MKYQTRPLIVEAWQVVKNETPPSWVHPFSEGDGRYGFFLFIDNVNDVAWVSDWIVLDEDGNISVMSDARFNKCYIPSL